jgi:hypothetical protein
MQQTFKKCETLKQYCHTLYLVIKSYRGPSQFPSMLLVSFIRMAMCPSLTSPMMRYTGPLRVCHNGSKGMQLCSGILVMSLKELLRTSKEDISYQQWCQAFDHFMLLVEQFCTADCPGRTAHYCFLVGHKSFKGNKFNLYLMYNMAICFTSISNKLFNLATVQNTVLAYALLHFQASTTLAEMQLLFASSVQVAGALGPVQSGSSQANAAAAPANTALAKHHSSGSVNLDKLCLRCGCHCNQPLGANRGGYGFSGREHKLSGTKGIDGGIWARGSGCWAVL